MGHPGAISVDVDDFTMETRNGGGPLGGGAAQCGHSGPRHALQNSVLEKRMINDSSVAHPGPNFGRLHVHEHVFTFTVPGTCSDLHTARTRWERTLSQTNKGGAFGAAGCFRRTATCSPSVSTLCSDLNRYRER